MKRNSRPTWIFIVGAGLLVAVVAMVYHGWATIAEAMELMRNAHLGWLAFSVVALLASFICAGQIYGRVLRILGYRAPQPWLIAAALVSMLISQAIPAGSVASYTFLTASLRRRGIPGASVALLASLELCTWICGMLVMFCFGLVYKLLMLGEGVAAVTTYPSIAVAVTIVGAVSFTMTRPTQTLQRWVWQLGRPVGRILRRSWSEAHFRQIVEEIDHNRRLIVERPAQMLRLLSLQILVFVLHSLALLMLLYAMGAAARPLAVVSAYGLALIVSTFTALPGGGGTVEAALTLSLTAEGVPPEAALGATIIFRLLSFWLLLPLGALLYHMLTAGEAGDQEATTAPDTRG